MTDLRKVDELDRSYRNYFDKMINRGFKPGQIVITSIMISISQYSKVKGVGAGIHVLTSCLQAIMEEDDIDITKIFGYFDKSQIDKNTKNKNIRVDKNIIHYDFEGSNDQKS